MSSFRSHFDATDRCTDATTHNSKSCDTLATNSVDAVRACDSRIQQSQAPTIIRQLQYKCASDRFAAERDDMEREEINEMFFFPVQVRTSSAMLRWELSAWQARTTIIL